MVSALAGQGYGIGPVALSLPCIVGRGGIETEITVSSLADPQVIDLAGEPDATVEDVVVARRAGEIVAVAYAAAGELLHVVGDADLERHLLKAAFSRQ